MDERASSTHPDSSQPQRVLFSNLCRDPPFLSDSAFSSVPGKGERSLGGATLIALGNLPVMQGHQGKNQERKNRSMEEKLLPKIVIESLWIYLEHTALHINMKPNKSLSQSI